MSIFGQVWLWSAAAFLLGVLLTWVFLVRPAQARSRALERRLQAAQAQSKAADAPGPERRTPPSRTFQREETPAPVPPVPAAAPAVPAAAPPPEPEPDWHEQGSFGRTAAEATSSALEPELASERTSIFQPAESYERERQPDRGSLFDPSYEPPAAEAPSYSFSEEPAPDEHAEDATHLLPRRQRRSSPRGGFEPPQPIQPSMRPIERREPVALDEGGRSGSLFEPVVRPHSGGAHSAPEPPPARGAHGDPAVPAGPFGPGSAMPMPGGASPSEEFTVKASVTALRYCGQDSPQFPRMVAEVWFRTAEDAERVGFRPLT